MEIETLPVTDEHLQYIAEHMRPADRIEVLATGAHATPLAALRTSVAFSQHCAVFVADGVPLCVFGVAPVSITSGIGAPWLLGSVALEQHVRRLIPKVAPYIRTMLDLYPTLVNHVHADNRKALVFLRKVGFTVHAAKPVGIYGAMFHRFTLEK